MEKIKIVHDQKGNTLTIWLGNPNEEYICEETTDELILMKDKNGKVIGIEVLHYSNSQPNSSLIVETVLTAA